MKNRRIWIIIACILIVGAAVTWYTNSYVKQSRGMEAGQEAEGAPMAAAAQPFSGGVKEAEDGGLAQVKEPGAASARVAAVPAESLAAAEEKSEVLMDRAVSSPSSALTITPLSPLEGEGAAAESEGADYRRRLEELDRQIASLEEENAGANVYSVQTSAASELKLWESEMNNIYSALLDELPDREAVLLADEQQKWLKDRDMKAAGGEARAPSLRSVEYTAGLADLTRERAYELAGRYEELMQAEK